MFLCTLTAGFVDVHFVRKIKGIGKKLPWHTELSPELLEVQGKPPESNGIENTLNHMNSKRLSFYSMSTTSINILL